MAWQWAAAWLHGFVAHLRCVDVLTARRRSPWVPSVYELASGRPGVRLHTTTDLPRSDIVVVQGVPATSVARTLLGLAALVPRELSQERLTEMLVKACEDGRAGDAWLMWLLDRRRISGRDGVVAFEEALATRLGLGPTESWLERAFVHLIVDAGLPRPQVQRRVERRGRFVGRVDFGFQGSDVVAEALGYAHHRSRADLDRDTRRANALQLAGHRVLQFGYGQIVDDPRSVVGDVADALGVRLRPAA